MKRIVFAFAALAAFGAGAITATKEYVDRLATNRYTKAETDARIVELSPAPDMSGVVHGDDRADDKSQFEDGLKFRASDSDGGNMRFRIQDPLDNGISWYSQSSGTTLGNPFFRVNASGIRHPTDRATPYKLSTWDEITRAHSILEYMPTYTGQTGNNYEFPVSAGAVLNWFWNLTDFPSGAIETIRNAVITTNDVCNIVTNEVAADWTLEPSGFNEISSTNDEKQISVAYLVDGSITDRPRFSFDGWYLYVPIYQWTGSGWAFIDELFFVSGDGTERRVELTPYAMPSSSYKITATAKTQNALGFAKRSDITNVVTKAYVESLGIDAGIQEESDPVWSSEKGNYATKQNVTVVSNLAASADTKANTLISYVNGDDVMDVVTNYDSAVHISSRSLRQRVEDGGTNYWRVVWDEMNRWNWFLPQIDCQTNALWNALSEKADRAWGFYDSHTGGWSPDGYLQISAPKILVAAGMAYQRHITTGGAVWVLESNGLVTEVGGVASNGFFRISDDDGNALFEIVKGNKRTVGSTAGALTTEEIMGVTHMHITYAVEAAEHPIIEATYNLGTAFVSEESASSIVNVDWTGSSGAWVAEVWPKTASSSLFVRASHEIGGETYIKNTAPTGLDGGIMYNGTKYRVVPYSTGGKTYLTLEAW